MDTARSQMASLSSMLGQMAAQASADGDMTRAQMAVEGARMGILAAGGSSGSSLASGGPGQGESGKNSPGGNNAASGQGAGMPGQSGTGAAGGTGSGQGQGQGSGSGAGMGSTNADSSSGKESTRSSPVSGSAPVTMKYGQYEKIYAPERIGRAGDVSYVRGQAGSGPQQTMETSNPEVVPSTLRPYQEVIGEYSTRARESLDRSVIPSGMKDVVRGYFTSLE